MYNLNEIKDFKYLTFPCLEKSNNLFHCFTTRAGGISEGQFASMNLGFNTGDKQENVIENYKIIEEKLNIRIEDLVRTQQTHTNNIMYVTEKDKGKAMERLEYQDIDGLYTDKRNVALMTFHADCTPVFFFDPVKRVIGMVHAGWRGTLKNISANMVKALVNDFSCSTENIKVVIGPSLGQCCFEVDKDVADMFILTDSKYKDFMKIKGEKYHFDLWKINKYILIKEGIRASNIDIAGLCTKCHNDLFFSHRGQKGERGLMCGIIMMK